MTDGPQRLALSVAEMAVKDPVSTQQAFQCPREHTLDMELTEYDKCPGCGQRFEDMGL